MATAVPVRHLLSLLHSDVEAIIARAPQMERVDRQIALELAIALAWNVKPKPIEQIMRVARAEG